MKKEQKKAILQYVRSHDPTGKVVKLQPTTDLSGGTIAFGGKILQHRIETELKAEKWVEAYLVTRLVFELGYPANAIELQKEYPAGHPETTKPRVDVVVRDDRDESSKTFMIIEAKEPDTFESEKSGIQGQLFGLGDHERPKGLRYLAYYTVDFQDNKLVDKVLIIDAIQFNTFESWEKEGSPSLDRLPIAYASAIKSVYLNKRDEDLKPGERNLNKKTTRNQFMALRRDLHRKLWGGGGTPDNDVFSTLVKLFLAKIYDEQFTPEGQPYTFQIQYKDGKPQPALEVVHKLNSRERLSNGKYAGILRQAQKEYLEMQDDEIVASQGLDTEKVSPGKIAYVVEELQGLSLTENETNNNNDILGEFFEGIVRAGFKQSKGQFFTHSNIVRFCIYALKVDDLVEDKIRKENTLPLIIDPSCGSGTFLIEVMKAITMTVKSRMLNGKVHKRAQQLLASWFSPPKQNTWAKDFIYGIEISSDLALATKVNMVLHGDGNINVLIRDGLLPFGRYEIAKKASTLVLESNKGSFPYKFPVNEQFDILLSNPPFSVDLDNETKRGLNRRFEFASKRNSENLFIERWYQLLKPGGRMAVIVPEAALDTAENDYIRLFLFKYFHIKAIIALPELAFKPWTPTRTSLLFAVKRKDQEVVEYDTLWRKKTKEFRALLGSEVVAYVTGGDKLVSKVSRLLSQYTTTMPISQSPIETVKSLKGLLISLKSKAGIDIGHLARIDRYAEEIDAWSTIDPNTAYVNGKHESQLKRFLGSFFDARYDGRTIRDIIERHWEEIVQIAESPWWTFIAVAQEFDEEILYFEVENIGYKRTINREKLAPNELFEIHEDGTINLAETNSVLGQIRAKVTY